MPSEWHQEHVGTVWCEADCESCDGKRRGRKVGDLPPRRAPSTGLGNAQGLSWLSQSQPGCHRSASTPAANALRSALHSPRYAYGLCYSDDMQTTTNERIALVLPSALVRRLDDWRRGNTIIPPRAAVLRALIERGLDEIAAKPPTMLRRAGKAPVAG